MGRFRSLVVIGTALLVGSACASRPITPPREPEDLRQTRRPTTERPRRGPLVAPPPAYGNKVVDGPMAEPPASDVGADATGSGGRG